MLAKRSLGKMALWTMLAINIVFALILTIGLRAGMHVSGALVVCLIQIGVYSVGLMRFRGMQPAAALVSRRGFTLVEVLVTVTIIAVLAAVVVPSVVQQAGAGSTNAIEQNATNASAALQMFMNDVQRAPGRPSQLVTKPDTSKKDIDGKKFLTVELGRWKGAYLSKDSVTLLNPGAWAAGALVDSFAVDTVAGMRYAKLIATGLAHTALATFDEHYDGTADSTKGNVRYKNDTLWFLMHPVP